MRLLLQSSGMAFPYTHVFKPLEVSSPIFVFEKHLSSKELIPSLQLPWGFGAAAAPSRETLCTKAALNLAFCSFWDPVALIREPSEAAPCSGGWGLLHGVRVPLKRSSPGHQLPCVPKKQPEGLLRD